MKNKVFLISLSAFKAGSSIFPIIGAAAVIDSVNFCAFSVLLLTIAFLFNAGQVRLSIYKIGSAFIAGIFVVYVLIGLGILRVLYLFNTPDFIAKFGAVILIFVGVLKLLSDIFPSFPIRFKLPQSSHRKIAEFIDKASVPASFLLGGFVGLSEFPCTGGPYLMILGLLRNQGTYLRGFSYLILYNLIFVIPLIVVLILAGNKTMLDKIQSWKKIGLSKTRVISGVAMIMLGALILILY